MITTIKFTGYPAGDRHCIRKYNVYLLLEIEIDIVSKNWTLSVSFFLENCLDIIVDIIDIIFVLTFQWLKLSNRRYSSSSYVIFICLFHMSFLNYFLTICTRKKPKSRGIYLAVKIILLEISPARDIYL